MASDRTCSIDGCEKPYSARSWCSLHWKRWWKHGDPLVVLTKGPIPASPEARFWDNVDKNGPDGYHFQTGANLGHCWLWTGLPDSHGYGRLWVDGRKVGAHRFAYELLVGPIPEGLEPDHLCRVTLCVRSDHLEPVTHQENLLRGDTVAARNAAKTHCLAGHAFSAENTYLHRGGRHCRACARIRQAGYPPL